jgi:two-component system, OmpR family, sensor histidine kinase KdpD
MSLRRSAWGFLGAAWRLLVARRGRRPLIGLAIALIGPVLVTVVSTIPSPRLTVVPALLYLLPVVAAAAVGPLWTALLAAGISFVALDYYFTDPVHTFVVAKAEDLLALALFLLAAGASSAVLSLALDQRARAEFRERQVRALYNVTARLLVEPELDGLLADLAQALVALYRFRGCRILVADAEGKEIERASSGDVLEGDIMTIPLTANGRSVGRIEVGGASPRIGDDERQILDTLAGQLALGLERARLGEEASSARLEAEASRIRAALFSSVTHDLRTPLSSIKASASSLLEEGVPFSDEQRQELLRTILEESERLNRLVANLMDLSRLRAGALTPVLESVPIEDLISSVVRRLKPTLRDHPVQVRVRDDVPPVPMDVVQMDQALSNLLENAARFSQAGSEITISVVRWHNIVEVKVVDHGPGIPPGDRGRVFEEFYRQDVEGRRGGTGLGLSIARAVVMAHGGTMWVEDSPGGGATLGFRLPLARAGVEAAVRGAGRSP